MTRLPADAGEIAPGINGRARDGESIDIAARTGVLGWTTRCPEVQVGLFHHGPRGGKSGIVACPGVCG
jgi:hypothetical protein